MQRNAGDLAASIAAFFTDLGPVADRVTLVTISEFGRRVQENANGGLDHGWGNVMLVAGAGVKGGQYYGTWPGLDEHPGRRRRGHHRLPQRARGDRRGAHDGVDRGRLPRLPARARRVHARSVARRPRRTTKARPGSGRAFVGVWAQASGAFWMAEMSNSSLIFSETSTPPVSSAAFQVRPQSLRLMLVPPSKPMRRLPNGSRAEPVDSKVIVIGLVSPLMVRSPVMTQSSPSRSTLVEEKVISLLLSASKKSADLRWPSRSATPVSMLAVWMVSETVRVGRVGGVDVGGAGELGEVAADRGDHRVAGAEAEAGVGRVDGVVAGDVLDGGGGGVELLGGLAVEERHGDSWSGVWLNV